MQITVSSLNDTTRLHQPGVGRIYPPDVRHSRGGQTLRAGWWIIPSVVAGSALWGMALMAVIA